MLWDGNNTQNWQVQKGYNGISYQTTLIDSSTRAQTAIEYEHHAIHAGDFYSMASFQDVGSGSSYNFYMKTPATAKYIHVYFDIGLEGEGHLCIFEDSTATVWGETLIPVNHNRNSSNISGATLTVNTSCNVLGACLYSLKGGSTKKIGGESRGFGEFVLKPNIGYLFSITEDSAAEKWMSMNLHWYEHIDES